MDEFAKRVLKENPKAFILGKRTPEEMKAEKERLKSLKR